MICPLVAADSVLVYGSWYFCSKSEMPKHPTIGAFKRSMTYSFGSICFGSLLVSIIQLVKQAASLARSQTDGILGTIVMCLITFIISIVQWLAEFFNVCFLTRLSVPP